MNGLRTILLADPELAPLASALAKNGVSTDQDEPKGADGKASEQRQQRGFNSAMRSTGPKRAIAAWSAIMADLEQRRQQYNAGLSQQWEADPQGKLISSGRCSSGSANSTGRKIRSPEETGDRERFTHAGGPARQLRRPRDRHPCELLWPMRADRLSQEKAAGNEDASVAPLALAMMMPMGALESRVGNLYRGAKGGAGR